MQMRLTNSETYSEVEKLEAYKESGRVEKLEENR